MSGPRIVAAKRELIAAIDGLNEKVEFTVLTFNARVNIWQKKLVRATSANKLHAESFVEKQTLGLGTASYDALEVALKFDAEAVYFLTDGEPFGGKIDDVTEIVDSITRLNRVRRMSINAFGVGN